MQRICTVSGPSLLSSFAIALAAAALVSPQPAGAAGLVTACTPLDICYCVNSDYREVIEANVARVRQLIASNKAQGMAIGYLSIQLSPARGGSFAVNSEIAAKVGQNVTARFGAKSMWLLNPGRKAATK